MDPLQNRRDPLPRAASAESGQALVEAAIILPAMIFLFLCILQLTLLQQARIMVEYAAFNAARVGVVHNMNNGVNGADPTGPMRNAAVYSILPTYGQSNSVAAIATSLARYEVEDAGMRGAGIPIVQVAVLNPTKADFAQFGQQLGGQEIDFDDMRPAAAPATLLSIQVRYLFELKVPFANQMLEAIWFASQVGLLSQWTGFNLSSPTLGSAAGPNAVGASIAAGGAAGFLNDGMPGGLNMGALAAKASGGTRKFYMPVDAWFTMRMQSNPYLQWAQ